MLDNPGIIDHLNELNEALNDCKRYRESITIEELEKDRDKLNMVKQALFIAIQSSIDVANHLIAEKKLRRPDSYRNAFEILNNAKIIDDELKKVLSNLASFRNVLIHMYLQLDLGRMYEILQKEIDELHKFKKIIKEIIKNEI